jgi:multimeric flavodoxin WrbA
MKVLVFNGSPNMDKGNTALILNPFIEGMREEGAEVELQYVKRLKINPCQGEMNCWLKTPGKCLQKDDMNVLYPKLLQADVIVFAVPVYVDGMPGPMKTLIDRLIPLIEPYVELCEGHCRHTVPEGHKHSKVVLVSTCGFWEMDNFNSLVTHMQAICKNACWEYAGALLRPHSGALWYMLKKGMPVQDVIEAAKKAGRELARDGRMEEETLKIVSREPAPLEVFVSKMNRDFKRALDRLETEKIYAGKQFEL